MNVSTETLLPLKAYYLGRTIAESEYASEALEMIDAAISQLEKHYDDQSQTRLMFYVLLKSEVLRNDPQVTALRERAQSIAEKIGSILYNNYMAVEEKTQTKRQVVKRAQGHIFVGGDIQMRKKDGPWTKANPSDFNYDPALIALGILPSNLSNKQKDFLRDYTLLDMLKHHNINLPDGII